jgi:hypothetical protein
VTKIQLENVADIMAKPSPTWLVRDWLPLPAPMDESLCLLYGPSGKGKSFVALDFALSVAAGIPWVDEYPVQQGAVLYIAAEGTGGLKRRIAAWREHHPNADVRDALFLLQPVDIYDDDERQLLLDTLEDVLDGGEYLHAEDGWVKLSKPLRMVVVDTVARMYQGDDENSNAQMGQFIEAVQTFSRKYGAVVLLVHHSSKADVGNERGGSALRGAATACFLCQGMKKDGKLREVKLTCNKMKDADEGEVELRMEEHELLALDRDDRGRVRLGGALTFVAATSGDDTIGGEEEEPKSPLSNEEVMVEELEAAGELTFSEWLHRTGLSKATFARLLKKLRAEKKVLKKGANFKVSPRETKRWS